MDLFIESISHNGEGVARNEGKVVFIPYAIPGEVVKVNIIEEKKKYSRGILRNIIRKSPHRVDVKCPHFYQCGGCSYQHISYQQQLVLKQNIIKEILHRIGGINPKIMNVMGMPYPWHYRNKVLWHSCECTDGKKIGFYRYQSRQLIEVDDCALLLPGLNATSLLVKEILHEVQLEENSSVMIRQSNENKEIIIEFINCSPDKGALRKLSQEVEAIYENQHGKIRLLSGRKLIQEKAGKCLFYLGPDDFFQVNPEQTEYLIGTVYQYLNLSGYHKVLDAYCGIGMFSLNIAGSTALVIGIDSNIEAVKHAKRNSALNGIINCQFIAGSCEKIIPAIKEPFDRIIVNPPRAGLKKEIIRDITNISPNLMVYVSCNPATLARDLKQFLGNGYRIVNVQPIDMFPQTSHIENIILLQR